MAFVSLIDPARRVLKAGLPAVVGVLGLVVIIAVAGVLEIVPEALVPVHTWIITAVTSVEGPVKFLISIMAAVFAFLKYLKKDDALTETAKAAAEILFNGYVKNFLAPLREVAVKDRRRIIIAMPTRGFHGDGDYRAEIKTRLGHLGVKAGTAGGKGGPGYVALTAGSGKSAKSAILDIPRTLVGADKMADQAASGGSLTPKDRAAARRRLSEAFFALLQEWIAANGYERDFTLVVPARDDDSGALAGKIADTLAK